MIDPGSVAESSHVRLERNTVLSLVAIGALGAGRLIYNVAAGRRFGPAALGQATLAINAAMFASLLVSGGWQASTARYLSQSLGAGASGEAAAIYRRTLVHNTAGGVVVAALCVAALIAMPGIDLGVRDAVLTGAIAFTYNAYQHLKAASYGFGRVGAYLKIELLSSVLLLAAVALVAVGRWRAALLAPVVVAYAVFAAVMVVRLRADAAPIAPFATPPSPLDPAKWREIKSFTALAIVGTIASAGFLNLSAVFAGRYGTPQDLGRFSAALAVVLPVYFLPRALSLALFPSIAFRYGQQRIDSVRRQLDEAGRALAVLLLAPVAAAAVVAPLILRVLFGRSYQSGAELLAIMLGATYLSVVQIPYVTALSGTERRWYKVPVLASSAGFALGLLLWVTLGARYGVRGVAWGYVIGSIPQAVIPIAFASRAFDVRVASVFARATVVWGAVAASIAIFPFGDAFTPAAGRAGIVLGAFGLLFAADARGLGRTAAGRLRGRRDAQEPAAQHPEVGGDRGNQ